MSGLISRSTSPDRGVRRARVCRGNYRMAEFEPVLLRRILKKASPSLDAYRADGGYRPLEKALNEMQPAQVIDAVKTSGLRGRGGAGFPCGLKWTFLPKDHPGPIYMCINADESEPCTFNNRILMEEDDRKSVV